MSLLRRKSKSVCIAGFAGGRQHIPFGQKGWEIWGFNQMYRGWLAEWAMDGVDFYDPESLTVKKRKSAAFPFHRWFELHTPDYFVTTVYGEPEDEANQWPAIARELCQVAERVPLYLPQACPDVPKAKVYPLAKVQKLTPHGSYHAGSFDWMTALAIAEGFTRIRITGVDFSLGGEPISARPCLEYWIGVAEAKGIEVEVMGGDLLRIFHLVKSDTPYGFAPWRLVEEPGVGLVADGRMAHGR